MPKKSEINESNIKIIHKMADGTVRDSIDGYEMPHNGTTSVAYDILIKNIINNKKQVVLSK